MSILYIKIVDKNKIKWWNLKNNDKIINMITKNIIKKLAKFIESNKLNS